LSGLDLGKLDIKRIVNIAIEAGSAVMQIYKGEFEVEYKDDNSPLTKADTLANNIICAGLRELYLDIPIMSEESREVAYEERRSWEYYWCIDPIDGTKEFIKKNGEFTINIALVHGDTPVAGVVYAPARGDLYYAKRGEGAYEYNVYDKIEPNFIRKLPYINNEIIKVAVSRSHINPHTQEFVDRLRGEHGEMELVGMGSSLKLCMVASGELDIYPRLAPTMEWDTAAADAIVREAGKACYIYDTKDLLIYNKEDLLNPWFVVR